VGGVEQFALFDVDGAEEDLGEPLAQELVGGWGGVFSGFVGFAKGDEGGAEEEEAEVVVDL
jgi:hypothetical protein